MMVQFGNFEAVREVARTALGGVWTCQPMAGNILGLPAQHAYAVKALLPDPSSIPDEHWLQSQIGYFLDQANLLQKLAKSEHWIQVYEVGNVAGGAYVITDFYDNSVQRLLNGHVEPTGRLLFSLADAVVGGLKELKELCQCSHGNLRPNNVLVSRSGKHPRPIVLSDPLPKAPASAGNEAADLRALGEMIGRIVLRRPTSTGSVLPVWPLPDAPAWRQLGKSAEAWREFCNFLLDPYSPPESRNLAEARRQLDLLAASTRSRLPQARRWAIAACALIALVGGAIAYRALHQQPRQIAQTVQPPPASLPVATSPTATSVPARPSPRDLLLARVDHEGWAKSANPALQELGRAALRGPLSDEDAGRIFSLADAIGSIVLAPGIKPQDIPPLAPGFGEAQANEWKTAVAKLAPPADPDPRVQNAARWNGSLEAANAQLNSRSASPKVLAAAGNLKAAITGPEWKLPWTIGNREQIRAMASQVEKDSSAFELALKEPDPYENVRQYIASERQRALFTDSGKPVELPAIASLWRERHEALLKGIEKSPDAMGIGTEQISHLEKALIRLNAALAVDPSLTLSAGASEQAAAFEKAVSEGRTARTADALQAFPAPPYDAATLKRIDDASLQLSKDYLAWCDRAKSVREALDQVNTSIDRCYLPNEKPPGLDRTVRQCLADCHPEQTEKWRPLVAQAEARVRQLDGLTKLKKPAEILSTLEDATPPATLASWRQLGKLTDFWPAQVPDVQAELSAEQLVKDRVVPIRPDVAAELQTGRMARWDAHLTLAVKAGADAVGKTVEWASANPELISTLTRKLPSWFQFDLLLHEYQSDPRLRADVVSFRANALKLEAPAVHTFLLGMDEQMKPRASLVVPEKAAVALRKGRTLNDGTTYTAMDGQIKVTFIHVLPKDPSLAPFYMGTTEVPIGLFASVIAQGTPGRYFNQVKQLLPNPDAPQSWVGPHGWEVDNDRRVITPRQDKWCDDFQFKNGQRPIPLREHPMQYVTPEAAMYLARLIGCRLPTAAEWREAYEYSNRQAVNNPQDCAWVMAGWKLRDAVWDEERDQANATAAARWLDDGIFGAFPAPFGTHAQAASWTSVPWVTQLQKEKGSTVTQIPESSRLRDGRLNALVANNTVLFRPCSYNFNECFHDLVGNVAEYVLDQASATRADSQLPAESPEKVAAFFQSPDTKLYVIGGSALSPPEFGFDQPLPVTHEQTLNGFSDVGFRLVFSDPDARPKAPFDLASAQYLIADQPPAGTPAEARR
jgi:hypothetical protein